jgi:hypothetical protein
MNPTAKITELLGCIDEVICVGGRGHRRFTIFVVLFVSSSARYRRNFKILRAKKEAQEAFDEEIS